MTIPQQASLGPLGPLRSIRGLIACWGVVVLSAAGASAGAWVTGGAPPDGSLQGMSRRGVDAPAAVSTRPGQAGAAPWQVELADPHLASTALKREQLTYLVRCALPEGVEVVTQQGAERFTFPGRIGLAPRWVSEALTPREERWISACLLAHVNAFGKPVPISLRAHPPSVPALQASAEEQQAFTIFEGGFFGNLFTPVPVAYACRGERPPEHAADPVLQDRVCIQETGARTADGRPLTACRLIQTGRCEDAASLTVEGQPYAEVIFTYLRPRQRP
jgi:hypothetical protein